ncbi:hypothetical protein F5882DRAFT_446482 [Hyaloscypha sp. PMI_1271]|nr:hypothetical protein F5882DRAFT_446482 [Hyaloscypha sp. PMI_1271]
MSNIRLGTSGHKFSFNNAGNSLRGNKFNVGGNITINAGGGSIEKECWAALFVTNPIDDRQKILTFKGQVYASICDWILGNNLFKSWSHVRTCSQLLWVSGKGGMGKTMLSVFLTQEFERRRQIPRQPENNAVVLYYFVDSREDKKNDATAVLRGLIYLLLRERQELMDYLLPEFEAQKDGLFSLKSIEALWRIFESMGLDASTGPVYCVIDGLDECTEDSLLHLLKKIKNFYIQQPQIFIDIHDPRNKVPGSQVPMAPGLRPNTPALKMVLVSREEPRFITEELADFPRIQVDIHCNASKAPSKPKRQLSTRAKQPTKLADIVSKVMKQRQSADHSTHAVPVLSSSTPDASLVSTSTMSTSTNVTSLEGSRVLPQPTLVSGTRPLTSDIPTQQQYRPPIMDAPPAIELHAESVVHPTVPASYATEAPLPSVQEEYVMDEEVEESDEEETADSANHEEAGGDPLHLYIAAKVEELS